MFYIDEIGIDIYFYRKNGRALRGEKVYDKISGGRFERTSVVAGQVKGEFLSPMIYKENMTSDFFMKWFETELIPSLSGTHLIVMDNATFHPKTQIEELCIENGHHFLPLPPYFPHLNPIEKTWASLKQSITELLRVSQSVMDCLIYYFKTK